MVSNSSSSNEKLGYLEGLRGCACAVVVVHHFCCAYFPLFIGLQEPTADNVRGSWSIANSPLRPLWAGQFSVVLFFVLSGNVLTRKFIENTLFPKNDSIRKKPDIVGLSHSILKRYMRLLIPVISSLTLCWFVHCLANFNDRIKVAQISQSSWFTEATGIERYGRGWSIVWIIIVSFFTVWTTGNVEGFNNVLWTLNIELKGSFLVFLLVAIVAPEHGIQNAWLAIVLLLCFYLSPFVITDSYIFLAAFIFGYFFAMKADKTIMNECKRFIETNITYSEIDDSNKIVNGFFQFVSYIWFLFVICLVWDCACIPQMGVQFYRENWWYGHQHVKNKYVDANGYGNTGGVSTSCFYELIGSVMLFHALDISPFLQTIFGSWPLLYLGKISFSLYLVHLPLLYTVSPELFLTFYGDNGSKLSYDYSVASTFVIMVPIWWIIAHIFWYLIDQNAVIWSNRVIEYIFPVIIREEKTEQDLETESIYATATTTEVIVDLKKTETI